MKKGDCKYLIRAGLKSVSVFFNPTNLKSLLFFVRLFVSGIKHAPGHVPLYQGWASLELRQDNIVEAKRLLAKALTLDKHNGCGWLIAASIEQRLGNVGLVGLILRRGIECAPSDAELYRALGEQLLRNGDIDNVGIDSAVSFVFWFHHVLFHPLTPSVPLCVTQT